ncbi:MAG: DUF1833 domain-containing protein, partial [bacterium]|nr:DUF1833 domain-containing protein [bacterium]
MRTLTTAMIEALTAQETGETFVMLLTIDHPDLSPPDAPLRFSSDPTERHSTDPLVYKTVSNGDDYFYLPMEVMIPDDIEGQAPAAELRISNVSRDAVALVRSVTTPATVDMELALASAPDDTITLPTFDLVGVRFDAEV